MAIPFAKSYCFSVSLAPTTLTVDTAYFSMRNTATADTAIFLKTFTPSLFFTGTAGNALSAFALQRKPGITPTGGTVITPTKTATNMAAPSLECRFSDAGLANTGAASQTERFKVFGQPSQALITIAQPYRLEDENLLAFGPGECLLIVAQSAIVSGAKLVCDFFVYETP